MIIDVIMPKMGESITEGMILEWYKEVGEVIDKDETLLEIGTDKVDSEVPSDVKGVLLEKLCGVNDIVKVGQTIALIETDLGDKKTIHIEKPIEKKTEELLSKTKDLIEPQNLNSSSLNLSP